MLKRLIAYDKALDILFATSYNALNIITYLQNIVSGFIDATGWTNGNIT